MAKGPFLLPHSSGPNLDCQQILETSILGLQRAAWPLPTFIFSPTENVFSKFFQCTIVRLCPQSE
jgi:hypothetical protein